MYGTAYEDVPSAVDNDFWEQEIKHPLRTFLQKWKDPEISNGLTVGGVVLDLEMYCRKKTGTFLSTMGFEQKLITKFLEQRKRPFRPTTIHQSASFLMKEQLAREYFLFLEQQAKDLGSDLRTFFDEVIPGGVIGCYTPMIMVDWFYKGLWQSISSPDKPMQLFTFNAEFNNHQHWFEHNNIQVRHASVLLLSKIQQPKDFSWVGDILKHHDGVWLNRFSRLVEDYAQKNWISVEQTPLSDEHKKEFFQYLDKIR